MQPPRFRHADQACQLYPLQRFVVLKTKLPQLRQPTQSHDLLQLGTPREVEPLELREALDAAQSLKAEATLQLEALKMPQPCQRLQYGELPGARQVEMPQLREVGQRLDVLELGQVDQPE